MGGNGQISSNKSTLFIIEYEILHEWTKNCLLLCCSFPPKIQARSTKISHEYHPTPKMNLKITTYSNSHPNLPQNHIISLKIHQCKTHQILRPNIGHKSLFFSELQTRPPILQLQSMPHTSYFYMHKKASTQRHGRCNQNRNS